MLVEILLLLLLSSIAIYAIHIIDKSFTFSIFNRTIKFISSWLIIASMCFMYSYIFNKIQYKIAYNKTGSFFNAVVLDTLANGQKEIPYRLFPQKDSDTIDPEFYKKPGIQAMLVEEDYNWVMKFVDPFSKEADEIVSASVVSAFVNKSSHGTIIGTELNVDVYITYNPNSSKYDKLTAYVSNENAKYSQNDKVLRCSLEKAKDKNQIINVIARGTCQSISHKKLFKK